MKINLAIIISALVLLVGFFTEQSYLWIPITVLIAGTVDLFTRQWVSSDELGSAQSFSAVLKLLLALIGFYAMIGQIICIGLLIWWFAFLITINMDILIFIVILAVLFYYFVMVRNGNLSFWKKASKDPDFVYQQLLTDNAWVIADGETKIDKEKYDGPFLLYVPSIGGTIKFYGEVGKYEDSQKRIEQELTKKI